VIEFTGLAIALGMFSGVLMEDSEARGRRGELGHATFFLVLALLFGLAAAGCLTIAVITAPWSAL
jgi:hypothetical protein